MTSSRDPRPRRDTFALPQAHGTSPFGRPLPHDAMGRSRRDAYALPEGAPLPGAGAASLSIEPLAQVIREAEELFAVLRPRIEALWRALEALGASEDALDDLFDEVSEGERSFTLKLSENLEASHEAERKARIALQQFQQAEEELAIAQEAHAQLLSGKPDASVPEGFSITKFRGMLHPLHNLGLVFEGQPMLQRLFPRSRSQVATQPLEKGEIFQEVPYAPPPGASSWVQRAWSWLRGIMNA